MKNLCISIVFILFLVGCQKNGNPTNNDLNQKLEKIIESNGNITKRLDTIQKTFITPYNLFEDAVLNENKRSPDSIITVYKRIIKMFPNSYWSHEAKKRIQNVEKRRELWSEEKGWELLKVIPSKDMETISCPGC